MTRAGRSAAPPRPASGRGDRGQCGERGQASVELLGGLPAVLILGLVIFQVLAVGYAAVLAGNAAEAGALAIAGGADARRAAREAVPGWSAARMKVGVDGGSVQVEMRPASPFEALSRRFTIRAHAAVAR